MLVTVLAVSDADAYKKAIEDIMTAVAPFTGRLAADAEKPPAWVGAPADHVVMIQFADADQAQAWKNSDAYKVFQAGLQKSSATTIQLVQGIPVPEGRGGRDRGGLERKAEAA